MNDFSELENQLRKLRPIAPSPELVRRVEQAMAEPKSPTATAAVLPRQRRLHFNWLSLGLGLAAATALVLFAIVRLQQPAGTTPRVASVSPAPAASTAQLVPAGLTQVVYHTRDEGLHFPNNSGEPMRRIRSQARDTIRWRNPKTGATLRISYPREEISLTPISGQ